MGLVLVYDGESIGTFQNGVFSCYNCDTTSLDDIVGEIPENAAKKIYIYIKTG